MKKLPNIHPGTILRQEFLLPNAISQKQLAIAIGVSVSRVNRLVHGKNSTDADMALRLSKYFGNTPQFWLGLQMDFDIEEETRKKKQELSSIKKYSHKTA